MTRIRIDPTTQIEGQLRIDCEVENGKVTKAWSSGQMWRGMDFILQGGDSRSVSVFTQRICGSCTTVDAIVSVRAIENALDLEIPLNAQYIRNMMMAAHGVHDHIVHFYHSTSLDWVDVVSALKANPEATAKFGERLSDYSHNSVAEIRKVKEKLAALVESGQLGMFASGYCGHPAMQLPPEINLLAATHYLQALEYQCAAEKIAKMLGSKMQQTNNLAVGGVANPINPDSQPNLTLERLYAIKAQIDMLGEFVNEALIPDVGVVGALYAEWAQFGAGVTNYLSVPDMPLDAKGTQFELPGGFIEGGDVMAFKAITSYQDQYFRDGVEASVKDMGNDYQRGDGASDHHDGQASPNCTEFQDDAEYAWVKAPTFYDKRAQVGPLANILSMYAAGHEPTKRHLNRLLAIAADVAGSVIPLAALHSTLGRVAARAVRAAVLYESLQNQWLLLMDNIVKGDFQTFNRPVFPNGEVRGFGFHETPRGSLSHWAVIDNGKIAKYRVVVPATWNAGRRDVKNALGPYEAALLDNPVADPELPLEVLRTVHSFDPSLACAIHMVDVDNGTTTRVEAG